MTATGSTVDLGLAGKAALVVGTGGGIGGATVAALAGAGASIACLDIHDSAAAAAADVAAAAGARSIALTADATQADQVAEAVEATIAAFGSIDIVVTVVGHAITGSRVGDTAEEAWKSTVDICLNPAYHAVHAAVGHMMTKGQGGAFVFISSIGGVTGLPGQAPYSAAKAGLMSLVKTLALEYGMESIRFNTVAPGIIATPEMATVTTPEQRAERGRTVPMRRMGDPEDVAKVVLFLASDLAGYVTGQTVVVDGGVTSKYQVPVFWASWETD